MSKEDVIEIKIPKGENELLIKAIIMYLLAPFGGLFFLNDPEAFVKFNAKQSIYLGFAFIIISVPVMFLSVFCLFIPFILISFGYIFLTFYLIIKAKDGIKVILPVIGKMAEK
ncbi:MAG: hypothetical protein WCK31_01750 [bacterium]